MNASILGEDDLRHLVRAYALFARERADRDHLAAWDGEHGIPASALPRQQHLLDAAETYLRLTLTAHGIAPRAGSVLRLTEIGTFTDEEHRLLADLNAWLAAQPPTDD
jgi:hypothetical protein